MFRIEDLSPSFLREFFRESLLVHPEARRVFLRQLNKSIPANCPHGSVRLWIIASAAAPLSTALRLARGLAVIYQDVAPTEITGKSGKPVPEFRR
jgi:hypothetical protein